MVINAFKKVLRIKGHCQRQDKERRERERNY